MALEDLYRPNDDLFKPITVQPGTGDSLFSRGIEAIVGPNVPSTGSKEKDMDVFLSSVSDLGSRGSASAMDEYQKIFASPSPSIKQDQPDLSAVRTPISGLYTQPQMAALAQQQATGTQKQEVPLSQAPSVSEMSVFDEERRKQFSENLVADALLGREARSAYAIDQLYTERPGGELRRGAAPVGADVLSDGRKSPIAEVLKTATSDLEARKERARGATLIGSDRQSMIMNVLVEQTGKSWDAMTPKEREDISWNAGQIARAERLGITVDRTANKDIPSAVKFIESRIEKIERDASKLGVDLGDVADAKRSLAQQTGKSVFEISDKDASQHAQFTSLENMYAEKVGTTDKDELRRIVEDEISSASRSSKKGEDFRISRKAREASDFLAFLQAKESPNVDKEFLSELVGKSSGFSKETIDEYLKSRKDAMESRKGMLDIEIKAQQLIDARNANEIFPVNATIERQGKIEAVKKSQAEAATALEKSRASRAVSDFALSSKQASDVMADIQTELAKKGTGKNGPNITALGEKYRGKGASAFSDYENGLSIYYEFLRAGGNK